MFCITDFSEFELKIRLPIWWFRILMIYIAEPWFIERRFVISFRYVSSSLAGYRKVRTYLL